MSESIEAMPAVVPVDPNSIHILLIENNAGDARFIEDEFKDLKETPVTLNRVAKLQEGLDYLADHKVDIVLSDLALPDSSGLETFQKLKNQGTMAPIVIFTGFHNEAAALDAVREGAQDYLIKGQAHLKTLSRTVFSAIERHRSQPGLRNLVLIDELTGLYNRCGFIARGEQSLSTAIHLKKTLLLFFANMDGLKQINDSYGYPDSDRALIGAADVLRRTFRSADVVSRVGGDQFAILANDDKNAGDGLFLTRLQGNLAQYNLQNPFSYKLSLKVGIVRFDPDHPIPISELISIAERNLQKKHPRSSVSSPVTPEHPISVGWTIPTVLCFIFLGWEMLCWLIIHDFVSIPAHLIHLSVVK